LFYQLLCLVRIWPWPTIGNSIVCDRTTATYQAGDYQGWDNHRTTPTASRLFGVPRTYANGRFLVRQSVSPVTATSNRVIQRMSMD
jgi:hypothetical protein